VKTFLYRPHRPNNHQALPTRCATSRGLLSLNFEGCRFVAVTTYRCRVDFAAIEDISIAESGSVLDAASIYLVGLSTSPPRYRLVIVLTTNQSPANMRSLAVNRTILPGSLDNDHGFTVSSYGLAPLERAWQLGPRHKRYPEHTISLGARWCFVFRARTYLDGR